MSPAMLSLILFAVQEAIKAAPALVTEFQALFAHGTPSDADFDAFRARIAAESYAQFVPASALPK